MIEQKYGSTLNYFFLRYKIIVWSYCDITDNSTALHGRLGRVGSSNQTERYHLKVKAMILRLILAHLTDNKA